MNSFPLGAKGADIYDVVFIGEAVPNHGISHIQNLLYNDYVFLFTTMLNQDADSYWYGHVNIDLVRHDHLSYFNERLRGKGSFHVLQNDSLNLNDFLEIVPEETENGIQIIAHLKKQKILGTDKTVKLVRDFRVLLFRENAGERFDNCTNPILELGPEFQAKIDLAEAEERCFELRRTSDILLGIEQSKKSKPELTSTMELVKAELMDAELRKKQEYERYLYFNRSLSYIHKRTN